jgi:hypothetical protein
VFIGAGNSALMARKEGMEETDGFIDDIYLTCNTDI